VRNKYQRKERKSNHKFEVVGGPELMVRVPLPLAEVWAEMQAQVEELTGHAGLQILRAILENEVTRRVGPPHRPNPTAGCVRWGKQPTLLTSLSAKLLPIGPFHSHLAFALGIAAFDASNSLMARSSRRSGAI
jgi:hypothetical protein